MKAKGEDLIFISRILRDGSGVEAILNQEEVAYFKTTEFKMSCLSISYGTYIASGFNSYVVKKKPSAARLEKEEGV